MAELFLTSAGSQWTSGAELWAAIRTPGTLRKPSEAFKPDPQSRESYVLSDACIPTFSMMLLLTVPIKVLFANTAYMPSFCLEVSCLRYVL